MVKTSFNIACLLLLNIWGSYTMNAQVSKEVDCVFSKKVDWVFYAEDSRISIDRLSPTKTETTTGSDEITIEWQIQAPHSKEELKFTTLINEKAGIKAEEANLFGDDNSFTYICKVRLPSEINEIVLQIEDQQGRLLRQSSPCRVLKTDGTPLKDIWAYWVFPNPNKTGDKPYVHQESELFVDFNFNTQTNIDEGDLYIYVNGVSFIPSSRAKFKKSGRGHYNFNDYVKLNEEVGINEIYLSIQTAEGSCITRILRVLYDPIRPNLHIISIGVPFPNLSYTTQDAKDIVALYQGQGGKNGNRIFNSIEAESLVGEETTAMDISGAITRLKTNYENGNIGRNDLVLLFISSHGSINENGELIIQGKGYDPDNPKTEVLYSEITEWLERVPCKKLVLIDACHSGGMKVNAHDINKAILRFSQASGISVIASSKGSQVSYEDDAWQNGAFTEAIIQGLKEGKADTNHPYGIITIMELYDYLSIAVPDMVQRVKSNRKRVILTQNPVLVTNGLGNVAIYINEK